MCEYQRHPPDMTGIVEILARRYEQGSTISCRELKELSRPFYKVLSTTLQAQKQIEAERIVRIFEESAD